MLISGKRKVVITIIFTKKHEQKDLIMRYIVGSLLIAILYTDIATAEVCVENDTHLGTDQFSVAFMTSIPSYNSHPKPHKLGSGDIYCEPTTSSSPVYLVVYMKPLLSDRARYSNTAIVHSSITPYSVNEDADLGFSVQVIGRRKPSVTVGDGETPSVVHMKEIQILNEKAKGASDD